MKTSFLPGILLLFLCTFSFVSCSDDEPMDYENSIEGLTADNFPIMDSSTSTNPLMNLLAYKLMGIPYCWKKSPFNQIEKHIVYDSGKIADVKELDKIQAKLKNSTTHGSYINLIDDKVELIIASRGISRDEKQYADEAGVEIIERPVGRDGLIFIKNKENPVQSLTDEQIKAIYTGKIERWNEVGGPDAAISPYMRDRNSGSQEKMETLVMEGLPMIDWPEMVGGGMTSPFYSLGADVNGIAYTPYYYCTTMVDDSNIKIFSVNGIAPDKKTIANGEYPYVSEICAAVRADVDKSSMAWKIFDFLTSDKANSIIEESGYVAYY